MTRKLDRDELLAIQEAANVAELPPDRIYRNYVGRGPSRLGFGIVYRTQNELLHFFTELSRRLDENLGEREYATLPSELADAARIDSMGKDFIVFFPGFVLNENQEIPQ